MAKQQSKPNYANPNYPKSMTAGGSRAGRQSQAQKEAVVAQQRAEAAAREIATNNQQGRGPNDTNYVNWYNAQQAALPKPSETEAE